MKQIEYISYGGGTPSLALIILNLRGEIKPITDYEILEVQVLDDFYWWFKMSVRKDELQSILVIYKLLKQDDSEYNLYNGSKILDKLIEKAENELEELKNE